MTFTLSDLRDLIGALFLAAVATGLAYIFAAPI
jgi:hypothetical protein